MEQHPVPQNVTTFQFRLIGDMTIKQFGYLAGGAILAFISYKLPLPFIITWPLTITFALGGFGFAFVPIEERPMDVWVLSFLKNIYSPTQYVWQRVPALSDPGSAPVTSPFPSFPNIVALPKSAKTPNPQSSQNAPAPVSGTNGQQTRVSPTPQNRPQSGGFFEWIDNLFVPPPRTAYPVQQTQPPQTPTTTIDLPHQQTANPKPMSVPPARTVPVSPPAASHWTPPVSPTPPNIVGTRPDMKDVQNPSVPQPHAPTLVSAEQDKKIREMQTQLAKLQEELRQKTEMENRFKEMQQQMSSTMTHARTLENELVAAKKQTASPSQQPNYKTAGVIQETKRPTVRVFTPEAAVRAGLPRLTSFPNVVTGIIKDFDNNLLPGVLVTVRDPEGIPVRALKTNKLGQFAASTPLPNGTYLIEVEDPRGRYTFDRVQFALTGIVMPAIEIIAKSKKEMEREDLEKKIFGQPM